MTADGGLVDDAKSLPLLESSSSKSGSVLSVSVSGSWLAGLDASAFPVHVDPSWAFGAAYYEAYGEAGFAVHVWAGFGGAASYG